jgi:hypothetical protein
MLFPMKLFVLFWFLLFSSASAQGTLLARYHPLPQAKKIPMRACRENPDGYTCPHGRVVRRVTGEQVQVRLELFGKTLPVRLAQTPYHIWGAWNTDLNQDGKADVIFKLNWAGNGIAFDSNITVFALSSKAGYRLSAINTITFDPGALVVWRGQPVVLHTSLVSAFSSRMGRWHSFWVYHPLTVRGTRLSAMDAPFWVHYTFKNNHRQTKKLTHQEKIVGLRNEKLQLFEPLKSW